MIKQAIQQITPPVIWNALRQLHHGMIGSAHGNERDDHLEHSYRETNSGLDADTILLRPGLRLRMHPDSREGFEHFCYTSPPMVSEMNMFLNFARERKRLLDIGALHGIFSLVFAALSPENKALAVDASPIAFARLLYNIHKNGFSGIKPVECAVSDMNGTLTMHYEWEHVVVAGTNAAGKVIHVSMCTGDSLCCTENFAPDIIKIDVEGHEIKVLKGLAGTIQNNSPIIFLEVHPGRILEEGDSLSFLEAYFGKLDYSARFMTGTPFNLRSFRSLKSTERLLLSPQGCTRSNS
jgi:FkbM family methyltransferase